MNPRRFLVNVIILMPYDQFSRLSKKAIRSKDVRIVMVDWDNIRELQSDSHLYAETAKRIKLTVPPTTGESK